MSNQITEETIRSLLAVVDQGLSKGRYYPDESKPSIDEAICLALKEPHRPSLLCISPQLRKLLVQFNDVNWTSEAARANGLRLLAVAQFGAAGAIDPELFVREVNMALVTKLYPRVLRLRAAAQAEPLQSQMLSAADKCESDGSVATTDAAMPYAAVSGLWGVGASISSSNRFIAIGQLETALDSIAAAIFTVSMFDFHASANSDWLLSKFAEDIVQILVEMGSPGAAFLYLAE